MKEYRSKEITRLLGVGTNQLSHWCTKGLIRPDKREASGSESYHLFSFKNLVEIAIIRELSKHKVSLKRAGIILQCLRNAVWEHTKERGTPKYLVRLQESITLANQLMNGSDNPPDFGPPSTLTAWYEGNGEVDYDEDEQYIVRTYFVSDLNNILQSKAVTSLIVIDLGNIINGLKAKTDDEL